MQKVGLIGTGVHGSRYANHIVNDLDSLELAGISRRSQVGVEQAMNWKTEYFQNWRDLVRHPEVEAVIAVTPPVNNLDIARECAALSKPLLLEKPLARNGEEAKEIVEIMDKADCPLTVCQTLRYNPVIQALKKQISSMGELHSFAVNQRLEPSALNWHDDPEIAGAGVIIHTAVHIFDALHVITGRKIRRVAAAERCIHSIHLADLVTILVECEDGTSGVIDVSKVGYARSGRYELVCQKGQINGDQVHLFTYQIRGHEVGKQNKFEQIPTILSLLNDWQNFIQGRGNNPVSGEDGLYAVQVCDACQKAARNNGWVEIN